MIKFSNIAVLILAAAGFASFAGARVARTETRTEIRREIRQTPMLSRPNRIGHFYGNNVRRIHHLRTR